MVDNIKTEKIKIRYLEGIPKDSLLDTIRNLEAELCNLYNKIRIIENAIEYLRDIKTK